MENLHKFNDLSISSPISLTNPIAIAIAQFFISIIFRITGKEGCKVGFGMRNELSVSTLNYYSYRIITHAKALRI